MEYYSIPSGGLCFPGSTAQKYSKITRWAHNQSFNEFKSLAMVSWIGQSTRNQTNQVYLKISTISKLLWSFPLYGSYQFVSLILICAKICMNISLLLQPHLSLGSLPTHQRSTSREGNLHKMDIVWIIFHQPITLR